MKLSERALDRLASRYIYPHIAGIWSPYSWQLPRRFALAEIALSPKRWPQSLPRLRVLLLSDIHTGPFLKAEVLAATITEVMALRPDVVFVAGDIVTARPGEVDEFLGALAHLSEAPLGAWFCLGNHDHFSGEPEEVQKRLESIGISTLRNRTVTLTHGEGRLVLGGIDDLILGTPDWDDVFSENGAPHVLLAHNPDLFYQAEAKGIPLVLSGHTHGGQIRFRSGPPIVRHSVYSLDEGAYSYGSSIIVVSRGLGAVGLPWRYGADPEAVWIEIDPPKAD
jgi:predicted MPP superfamily phosphohydrolase